jgi:hypothetical protein
MKRELTQTPVDLWRLSPKENDSKIMLTLADVRQALEAERKDWLELNGFSPEISDVMSALELVLERLREPDTVEEE